MNVLGLVVIGSFAYAGVALAQVDDVCGVAAHLVQAEASLPRAAAAIHKDHALTIVVVGTTSSALPGPDGARSAYPARLEAALAKRLPGVAVKVVSAVKPRQTTADMAETFERLAMDAKPNLVIWQTGTFDAMRGTDADEFRARLEEGIDMLQSKGSDIILMNMQYSPRTESTIALGVYAENMRWVALQHDLPLFDRLAVMKHWSEMGTFDLYSATRNLDTAAKVHNCIAQLLAELVVDAVKLAPADSKDTR